MHVRIALVPRSLDTDMHGPAFYFDVSLKKETDASSMV